MKENIDQMRQRHKREIEALQQKCRHKKLSGWMEQWWAPGHGTGKVVKVCEFCGKVVKEKGRLKFEYKLVGKKFKLKKRRQLN